MPNVETLILRFRDLTTPQGETVKRHNKIAEQHGYVWWGWWNKGGEQVPVTTFGELLTKMTNKASRRGRQSQSSLTLYLLDSGTSQLFEALCFEIKWSPTRELLKTPETAKTPTYYKSNRNLAWFKLGAIKPSNINLQTLSYVQVDEFFVDAPSKYTAFYNKRVHSTGELTHQNRTIWFVRPSLPTDSNHEISIAGTEQLAPSHFSRNFTSSSSLNLLWVSDLHYTAGSNSHHAFPIKPSTAKKSLGHAIELALRDSGTPDLAGVVVSGDVTWKADPAEFEQSKSFFDWTRSWAKLEPHQFAVCPGNHDVAFSARPNDKDSPIDIAFEQARNPYSKFYQDLFHLPANQFLSCGRRILVGGAIPIEIVCLNSSLLEQRPGIFQGHGFVGDEQLRDASKQLGWEGKSDEAPRPYRIVVLHHHLVPTSFREQPVPGALYSVVLDAEALMQWMVKHRVNLVLHGHMHQPSCTEIVKPTSLVGSVSNWWRFHVIGMGSTGVERNHLPPNTPNTFGVLQFKRNSVRVTVRSVDAVAESQEVWNIELPYESARERA
ncbi:metallophosphoesterase family protein [Corallococcus exercitus]|uniref:metallophosphoesterase family protein n=1 Tax=Corallococcus exercitus TaxID=2316736 RepID=UPI0035D3EDC7